MPGKTKSGGGAKKYGRNKVKRARYTEHRKRRNNKIRKAKKRYGRCHPGVLKKVLNSIAVER